MHPSASAPARLPSAGTELQREDLAMAEIANAVYDSSATNVKNGWRKVEGRDLHAYGTNESEMRPGSGLRAGVYTNDSGQTVVAFAGTNPRSGKDLATDVKQELGFATDQYRQAKTLVGKVAAKMGPNNVVVVGHSLGGGLASTSALENGVNAVVFNAAGVHNNSLSDPDRLRTRAEQGAVRHYHVDHEILQKANASSPFSHGVPGAVIKLESTHGLPNPEATMAPLQMHSMDRVISAMRTDTRFLGRHQLESARFAVSGLPAYEGQNPHHTAAREEIRNRDAGRSQSYQGFAQQAERTRLHVRDTRHAAADISHGRPVDFGIVDRGHRDHLSSQQEGSSTGSRLGAAGDSEPAAVMRQTERRGSTSMSTSVEKASGFLSRFKPNKDKGKDRER
jgi:pimeloyl-ACP methyl ester carboxylesterase